MFRRINVNRHAAISALLVGLLCVTVQAASLNLRVTTDKDLYTIGEEVNWTIWAWASEGDNRGVFLINVSLNDTRSEELYPALTVGTPPDEEFLDTEYGLEEGFSILGKGAPNIDPPRLRSITARQSIKILDIGNDGQPHIFAKGTYTVTKAGPHDLNVFPNSSLYWPDETSPPNCSPPMKTTPPTSP